MRNRHRFWQLVVTTGTIATTILLTFFPEQALAAIILSAATNIFWVME